MAATCNEALLNPFTPQRGKTKIQEINTEFAEKMTEYQWNDRQCKRDTTLLELKRVQRFKMSGKYCFLDLLQHSYKWKAFLVSAQQMKMKEKKQ